MSWSVWSALLMGIDTPTNFPCCSTSPSRGTKLPKSMPTAMASKIQSARNLPRTPRPLKAENSLCLPMPCGWLSRSVGRGSDSIQGRYVGRANELLKWETLLFICCSHWKRRLQSIWAPVL
ncbi:hypothetical protein F5Y17DRAFT_425757 [Xylariaceae sp. FL0594]|nr:hypothetical protein F5Y17DRAFT_425757 [Xylariaceae sp. FL0594]